MKYNCAICGKEFENVMDRASCELTCAKAAQEAAKKIEEEKKKAEQAKRKKEVDDAFKIANGLLKKYVRDYGSYEEETELDFSELDLASILDYFIF